VQDIEMHFSRLQAANFKGLLAASQEISRQQAAEIQPLMRHEYCAVFPQMIVSPSGGSITGRFPRAFRRKASLCGANNTPVFGIQTAKPRKQIPWPLSLIQ
jgi:hypothetical protein